MKKLINLKEIMIILISLLLIIVSTSVYATESVLGDETSNNTDNNATTITGNEYNEAQNNNTGNNQNKNTNTNTALPQTGIEDTGLGILLIACIGSAIFAYRKVSDYRNI